MMFMFALYSSSILSSHKSTAMAEKLQNDGICIPLAVITRWNSQYYTVSRIIEIPSDKLNDYLRELKKDALILSQRDISVLNEFVSVFALIAEVFTKAQADQSASISLVAPSLLEIYFDLDSELATLKYTGGLCKALLKSMGGGSIWRIVKTIRIINRCSSYRSINFGIIQRFPLSYSAILRCSIWV